MGKKRRIGKLSASITVEASYVMAMVLLALSIMIRTAYVRWEKATEIMHLHHVIEQLRNQEEEQNRLLKHGQVRREKETAEGYIRTETWEKRIEAGVYQPEEELRKWSVFQQDLSSKQ